jgi:proteasome assembly chaperone (PAC2) family protein
MTLHWEGDGTGSDLPVLRRPVMIAAFEGWNDAAEAATTAVEWLRNRWDSRRVAEIDPEDYFDFQSVRPHVTMVDGVVRDVRWPSNACFVTQPGGARDAVLLSGVEPSYRWRGFCEDVLEVATRQGCEMMLTLGALLADVPHTRPVRITGTAADPATAARLGIERSQYEGPTGIVGVLHDTCRSAGIPSVSLWTPVPHYVAAPPNPKATLALLEAVERIVGAPVGADELVPAVEVWHRRVDEAVADDAETAAYVRELEARADEAEREESALPTGDDLAAQLEQFLRDQDEGGEAGTP